MKIILCVLFGMFVITGCASKTVSPAPKGNLVIVSGTYGGNCGATEGNVTAHLASVCNGQKSCRYKVHHRTIGDPAYDCKKTYVAKYKCSNTGPIKSTLVAAEAGYGSIANLSCY